MQKLSALVVFFGAALCVAWTLAAEPGVEAPMAELPPCVAPLSPFDGAVPYAGPCCGRLCGMHARVGSAACCCRGSYKYPVLPQSTYFWPGIYSQQTMTAYVSPLRYPPLLLLPDVAAGASNSLNDPPPSAPVPTAPAKAEVQAKPAR